MSTALAGSTRNQYHSQYKVYKRFCVRYSLQPFPLVERILILFCTYLATRFQSPVSYNTIKGYLAAIRYFSITKGFSVSFHTMDQLYYTLRGIKRYQGERHNVPKRSPITTHHLVIMHTHLFSPYFPLYEARLYWSASTLAFFGLLRVSEYTTPKIHVFDKACHLLLKDITFSRDAVHVHIKASKCDPFRQGCTITIGQTNNILCPVLALKQYLLVRNKKPGPLFTFQDGSYLTRHRVVQMLRRCFTDVNLNTHSFRIGGASALAAAGVSDAQIQTIGRWRSNCFVRYLRISSTSILPLATAMSEAAVDDICWTPRFNKLSLN